MRTQLTSKELRADKPSKEEFHSVVRRRVSVVLDGVNCGSNLGNILRLADAMLVERVWVCGKDPVVGSKFRRATRGIDRWVDWVYQENTEEVLGEFKRSGYSVVAVELCADSTPLFSFQFAEPLVLVFGNESAGISPEALALCDDCVHLPMFGMGNSINLGCSVAIALYEAMGRG